MARFIQGMRRRCKARNSQKKARKEWEKQKPPRKVEPLPRGKVQERKKENRSAALGDAVRFLSFAESVGWAFPACSRNEVRREACPFSAEYQGKEKPRSKVALGEVFFSSFSAGKHSGLSPKYESRLARVQLRTCGASAKRGRLASLISSRAKFFRRGAARRGG